MGAPGALARALEWALPRIPFGWQRPISEIAGTVVWLASPGAREAVRANLAVIAPGRPARVRRVFVNQVTQYLEIFHIARLDRKRFKERVRVEGWDNYLCAREQGRGVIFGSAHLGPIALVGQILMQSGHDLTLPVEETTSEFLLAVNRARQAQGLRLVPIDSAIGIHRVLKRGGNLGVLGDRAVTGIGERVTLFGRETLIPSAHVALALRTGAPLIPAFAWREGGTLIARIEPPLPLARTGDRDTDVHAGVQQFAAVLERYVRAHPEQWMVFERMWNT